MLFEKEELEKFKNIFEPNENVYLTLKTDFLIQKKWNDEELNKKFKENLKSKNINFLDLEEVKIKTLEFEEFDRNKDYVKIIYNIKIKFKTMNENIDSIYKDIEEIKIKTPLGEFNI